MGKFKEASLKGKIFIITKKLKQFYIAHTKPSLPESKYGLLDLIKMNDGYQGMEKSTGCITKYVISNFIIKGQSVLDMPCGSACHTKHFLESGIKYSGMDLSENSIAVALLKYPKITFFNNSIYYAQKIYKENLYDVVYCCALLEHIGNWELAIKNMVYLSKDKVIIVFYEGLNQLMNQNYYEFHPFTDNKLLKFSIIPDYGYKPVITRQLSNLKQVYVFQQPGNYRIKISLAKKFCNLTKKQLIEQFDYDITSQTVSMRPILRYAQDYNENFKEYIPRIPEFIEKRNIEENEIGYFMNRFSKQHMINWMDEQNLKYEIYDKTKDGGNDASFIIIHKK